MRPRRGRLRLPERQVARLQRLHRMDHPPPQRRRLFQTARTPARHIVPWSSDKTNRLNPSNGLCLSAIHDRAFDKGLISLTDDWRVVLSDQLRERDESFLKAVFAPLEGRQIEMPERFRPDHAFLAHHRESIFLGRCSK